MTNATELVRFLREIPTEAGLIGRLKIVYRPFACPFAELLNFVNEGERVLDVGCGRGQFCLLLARFTRASWVGGIEISTRLVQNARELFANSSVGVPHRFEQYDGSTFPESVRDADKVFLVDVLHHVRSADQPRFLERLYASMKEGSVLILKDIDASSPLVLFNKLHDLVLSGEIGNELSTAAVRGLTRKAGFHIKHESRRRMWCYPHYTMVLGK